MLNPRRLLDNFVWATAMRVAYALLSFAFFVFLARRWAADRLGEFSTVLALFLLLYQAPLLGLHVPLIRQIAQGGERIGSLVASALALGLTTASLLGIALGLAGMVAYPPQLQASIWLVAVSLLPCAIVALAEAILVARERLAIVSAANMIESSVRTVAWFALVWFGFGSASLFACLILTRLLLAAAYLRWTELGRLAHPRHVEVAQIGRLLRWCPTFLAIVVLAAVIARLDFVMLSQLGPLSDVGMYAPAYRIYEAALMLPSMLTFVVFPAFSRLFKESAVGFEQFLRGMCRLCVTLGLPCAIALAFLAAPLMNVLYGEPYSRTFPVLQWLIFGPVLVALDQSMAMALLASGRQDLDLRVLAIASCFYLVILVVLVPRLGYLGAAIGTLLTAVVQVSTRYRMVRTHLAVGSLAEALARPAVGGAVMAFTVAVLWPFSTMVALTAGFAAYLAALLLCGAVTLGEVRTLRAGLAIRQTARS